VDKSGNVHAAIAGFISCRRAGDELRRVHGSDHSLKAGSGKGVYVRNVAISSTMGPGVIIDTTPYR